MKRSLPVFWRNLAPNKNQRIVDFALYFSEINVAGKTMSAFIQSIVRQHLGSRADRQKDNASFLKHV